MGFLPQGAFLRERFSAEGIGPIEAQQTAAKGGGDGLFVHQGTPCRVQQDGPRLHPGQRIRADKPPASLASPGSEG